ncbi:hypothetical protein [Krasilnikovia cinnamomea]|nr:hypothetical protein [Krasilnikovia cinnamomea]
MDGGHVRKRGPKPGTRFQGNTAAYDPTSGRPYTAGTKIDNPDEAMKLIRAAEVAGLSVAEVIRRAIRYMPVDEDGRPLWPNEDQAANEQLPLELNAGRRPKAA